MSGRVTVLERAVNREVIAVKESCGKSNPETKSALCGLLLDLVTACRSAGKFAHYMAPEDLKTLGEGYIRASEILSLLNGSK